MGLNRKNIKIPNNLENRTEKCLRYYIKKEIVCKGCENPYNKYCPFYIPFKSKK